MENNEFIDKEYEYVEGDQMMPVSYQTNLPSEQPTVNKEDKTTKLLCIISTICLGVCTVGSGIFAGILSALGSPASEYLGSVIESITALCAPASIVLMIIARVRDKKNVYAKVLMWAWIVIGILGVIALVVFTLLISWICSVCTSVD